MRYSNWTDQADYRYVAFIDESGDTGLDLVKPMDPNGASEWLIIGAVVVRAEHEAEMSTWLTDITSQLKGHQRPGIHFADLRKPAKKRLVCSKIADLPMRIFAMTSNKKNMKGYANPFAGSIPSDNWFYCWMTRILLERVTHFVKTFGDTPSNGGHPGRPGTSGLPGEIGILLAEGRHLAECPGLDSRCSPAWASTLPSLVATLMPSSWLLSRQATAWLCLVASVDDSATRTRRNLLIALQSILTTKHRIISRGVAPGQAFLTTGEPPGR